MTRKAGLDHWHTHEGRRAAVSIMSSNSVPIQDISDTVGPKSIHVTETVLLLRLYVFFVMEVQAWAVHILGRHRPGTETWAAQRSRNLLMDLGERAAGFKFLVARPVRQ